MTHRPRIRFVSKLLSLLPFLSLLCLPLFGACFSHGGAPAEPSDGGSGPPRDLTGISPLADLRQGKPVLWVKQLGASTNVDSVKQVAVDAAGNVFVGCQFSSTTDFGDGPRTSHGNVDVALLKLSAAGELLWVRQFGGTESEAVLRMVTDRSGNVLIAGAFSSSIDFGGSVVTTHGKSDFFLAKYAGDGRFLWAKAIGSTDFEDNYAGLGVDAAGNVYFAGPYGLGAMNVQIDLGGGPLAAAGYADSFLLKLDPNGAYVTSKRIGGPNFDYIISLLIDPSGDVLIGGQLTGTVDLGGGAMNPGSSGVSWAYVARLTNSFAYKWAIGYYSNGSRVSELAVDGSGAIAAAGSYTQTFQTRTSSLGNGTGSTHGFLLQLDAGGTEKWARSIANGSPRDFPTALVVSGSQLVAGGSFDDGGDFGAGGPRVAKRSDAFVSYYALDGAPQGVRQYGGSEDDATNALAVSPDAIYVGGAFSNTAKIEDTELTSKGFIDGFVAKLPPTPPVIP